MNEPTRQGAGICLPRRRFLHHAAMLCVGMASPAALRAAGKAASRTLRFVHTHTGEQLTTTYFDSEGYNPASLREVEHLLRDFRTGESHHIDPPLLDFLHDLQALAAHDAPYEIISAYRSPATNAMLHQKSSGVAERSQHLLGKAIDVRLRGFSTLRLSELARSMARGGVGYYASSDFVHLDTARVRFWSATQ